MNNFAAALPNGISLIEITDGKIPEWVCVSNEYISNKDETGFGLYKSNDFLKTYLNAFHAKLESEKKKCFAFIAKENSRMENDGIYGVHFLLETNFLKVFKIFKSAGVMFGNAGPNLIPGTEDLYLENFLLMIKRFRLNVIFELTPTPLPWVTYKGSLLLQKSKIHFESNIIQDRPYIELDRYKQPVSKNLIKNIRQRHNRLNREGLDLEYLEFMNKVPNKMLDAFISMHKSRWPVGIFQRPSDRVHYEDFHRNLFNNPESKIAPELAILLIGGELAAMLVGFTINAHFYCFNLTFDEKFSDYRPGQLLIEKMIESKKAVGVKVFDFMNDAEVYKTKWTSDIGVREAYFFSKSSLTNSSSLYFPRRLEEKVRYELKRILSKISERYRI
jgi:hypothetical protein